MISNNLRALLATPANRSLLSARVHALHANTLGHGHTHTTAICFLPQTCTQEPLSVAAVGFGNTQRFAKTNTYTSRASPGAQILSVTPQYGHPLFCLCCCGFQWRKPLDCTPLLTCCFAFKLVDCVYTSSQPQFLLTPPLCTSSAWFTILHPSLSLSLSLLFSQSCSYAHTSN